MRENYIVPISNHPWAILMSEVRTGIKNSGVSNGAMGNETVRTLVFKSILIQLGFITDIFTKDADKPLLRLSKSVFVFLF